MKEIFSIKRLTVADLRAGGAELIGTMLLVFIGAGAIVTTKSINPDLTLTKLLVIGLAFGITVSVVVAGLGSISGAHINPAVTISAWITKKIGLTRGLVYLVAQVAGGIIGTFLIVILVPVDGGDLGATTLGRGMGVGGGYLAEVILTFILVLVIFGTAMNRGGPLPVAPLVIGLTITADHLVGLPLTGISLNPARSLGPAIFSSEWTHHWIYWAGPITGGLIAAVIYEKLLVGSPTEE